MSRSGSKILCFLLVGVFASSCQLIGRASPERKASIIRSVAKAKFDLNDDQLKKFDDLATEMIMVANEMKDQRKVTAEHLIGQIEKNQLLSADIESSLQQRQALWLKHSKSISDKIVDLSRSLNTEQRAELVEWARSNLDDIKI